MCFASPVAASFMFAMLNLSKPPSWPLPFARISLHNGAAPKNLVITGKERVAHSFNAASAGAYSSLQRIPLVYKRETTLGSVCVDTGVSV